MSFRFFPAAVGLEHQFFDRIQAKIAIDSKKDFLYDRYRNSLEELFFINLDSSFFNFENNRIRQDRLASLFQTFNQNNVDPELIFLDYAYNYRSTSDSILQAELNGLPCTLILPTNFEIDGTVRIEGAESKIDKGRLNQIHKPIYSGSQRGYAVPFEDPYTYTNRYFKFELDDQSYSSVPLLMYQHSNEFANEPSIDIHKMTELHFILRNKDIEGKEPAVLIYDAKDIADGIMPTSVLHEVIKNKIVVIGLFNDYKTKYLNPIDKFITPIDSGMSGALLITNAYLNLANDLSYSKNHWLLIFAINFITALVICFNYEKNITSKYVSIVALCFNLFISVFIFYFLALCFYMFFSIQLSLGMSLLVYQKKYYIYSWYQQWWRDKSGA